MFYDDILFCMKNILQSKIFHIFFLAVVVFGLYVNSVGGDFVFDDKPMIAGYDFIKDINNLPKAFTSPTSLYGNTNYYRPLQTISNMIDYFLWGRNPIGFHFTNILFHLLAVLLLYWIVILIFKNRLLAFLTALLFTVHPVNSSAVAYIAGRADSMLLCFILLSFGFYLKAVYFKFKPKFICFSILFFSIALLTKEYAVMLPVLFLGVDNYFINYTELQKKKIDYNRYIPYGIVLIAYFIFRFAKMSFFVEGAVAPYPFFNRIITAPYCISQYFRLAVCPNDLHIGRLPWVARSIADPRIIVSIVVICAVTAIMFKLRQKNRAGWFGLCWFYLLIFPALNIITPLFYTLADNWLYIPGIGIYLVMASFVVYFIEKGTKVLRYGIVLVYVLFIISMGFITFKQNLTWANEISLGMNTLKYNPREFKIWNNLGVVYLGRGELDKAEESFNKCLEIKPDTGMAYFNLYRVYMAKRNRPKALKYLSEARKYDPKRVGILIQKMGIND